METATSSSLTGIFLISFASFFYLSTLAAGAAGGGGNNGGFSINLIHRDSPHSPFHNPSDTLADRLIREVDLSHARRDYLLSSSSKINPTITSPLIPNHGGYLMSLTVGTPPIQILAIADTGSDLTWIQCRPCHSCYRQDYPFFDPRASSTYRNFWCQSGACRALPAYSCGVSGSCEYRIYYGDHQSYSRGTLAVDMVTFDAACGSRIRIPRVAFGCGHNNSGAFNHRAEGIVGLGRGPLSLIRQLGSSIKGKFSYCLAPAGASPSTGTLNFGNAAIVSGEGAVSTPLVPEREEDTYYWVTLEKITVGNETIVLPAKEGNIIVDSGTTFTFLESGIYSKLSAAISKAIHLPATDDPNGRFSNCYTLERDAELPDIIFGFAGADVRLRRVNTFIQLVSHDVICLAIVPTEEISIFGNFAQQNFKVGYDLEENTLSFAPTDCASSGGILEFNQKYLLFYINLFFFIVLHRHLC